MASLRSRFGLPPETLYLIDGSAFVFRAFFAMRNMSRADGFPTNVLFSVSRLLLRLIREEKPLHLAFILDGKGPSPRKERFPEYKANRPPTPELLVQQLEPLHKIIASLGVPLHVSEGCEADDCIAALTTRFAPTMPVVIIGADKDLKQCLGPSVMLWDPAAKDEKITTLQSFREETGMEPASWPDYQALVGDSSDNIPGIAKIGPKTASALIQEFSTLESIFSRLAAVPPKIRAKLDGQEKNAKIYRELTRLDNTVCPELGLDTLRLEKAAPEPVLALFREYELHSLVREVDSMGRAGIWYKPPPAAPKPGPATPTWRPAQQTNTPKLTSDMALPLLASLSQNTPETKPASSPGITMEQGSLFALATIPEPADFTNFPSLTDPSGIPGSVPVFLLLLEETGKGNTLLLAFGGQQFLYTGPLAALAKKLAGNNNTIATPDSKLVCKAHPDLWQIAPGCWFDLSLAAYLMNPEDRSYSWPHLAQRYGELSGSRHTAGKAPGLLGLDIAADLQNRLQGAALLDVFANIEMPLVPVLARMEGRGITLDKTAAHAFLQSVQADLDSLTAHIHTEAGGPFNIRSSQQLADILFVTLALPKAGKTRGGAMSTSQEALEKLAGKHPIIEKILEYRKLEKLRSTYLEPLPAGTDNQNRIHTTFNQTATATGRLSSSNPNLQNIPIRGALGPKMRSLFIAGPNRALVCADYSQIELRVLAHLSQDPTLLEAFHNNEDIHSRTAALLFDKATAKVTPDERRNAKTINFGLIYGMGAQKLGQELGIPMKEAKAFIERYFARLAKLKEFYDSIEDDARMNGYVATMTGRRRLTPDIHSGNSQLHSQARRQAINTRIQGSAADIIKLAMIAVEHDPELAAAGASLLLQVHDELVLEVPPATARLAGERLASLMAGVAPGGNALSVPLLVDWGVGSDWSEAH